MVLQSRTVPIGRMVKSLPSRSRRIAQISDLRHLLHEPLGDCHSAVTLH
jgi:hypothetical protein